MAEWGSRQPLGIRLRLSVAYYHRGLTVRIDTDNLVKPIQDALIGLVYHDDQLVTHTFVSKTSIDGFYQIRGRSLVELTAFSQGDEFVYISIDQAPINERPNGEIMAKYKDSDPVGEVLTKSQILDRVAERYRSEGYEVTLAAPLACFQRRLITRKDVALLAHKSGEWVAIDVKRRDELYEINPLAIAIKSLPEWRYDLVVYPPDEIDAIPLGNGEDESHYVESLLKEAEELLDSGMLRAAFVMAWSAGEATMRLAAMREGVEIGNGDPRFVLKTLYSNGIMSFDVYERFRRCMDGRNRLVHGLPVHNLEPGDVRFMIESARQLMLPLIVSSQ